MYSLESLDPAKLGLVIMDLQKGYCDPASDCATKIGWDVREAEAICEAHRSFLPQARKLLSPSRIMWFQMEEHPRSIAPNLRRSSGFLTEEESICIQGTTGHDFHLVQPATGEAVFQKFHPNGFTSAAFCDHLLRQGITQLAFTGVIGSRCVNATIISASERGFACMALTDLIGGPALFRQEMEIHLRVTTHLYALPLTAQEWMTAVEDASGHSSINLARSA